MKIGEKPIQGVQSLETVTEEEEKDLNLGVENGESMPEDWTVKAIGNLAKNRQKNMWKFLMRNNPLGVVSWIRVQKLMCSLRL